MAARLDRPRPRSYRSARDPRGGSFPGSASCTGGSMRNLPLLPLLLATCIAAAGCENATSLRPDATAECTEASSSAGDLAAALSAARARWQAQGIDTYTLRYESYCYCQSL